MNGRADEIFFQIKDPYLELHESEKFVVKQNELKKDPRFEDTILRNTAYDPYYHKNEFNLSQTQHHFDISHTPTPFRRPEITQEYVSNIANKTGMKVFYPSYLPGPYVDVQIKDRVFESLLVRAQPQAPTEEEIIESLMKSCMKEEQAISLLQNDIQAGLEILARENIQFRNSFKNYFANLCTWMITGELKDDMNEKVLQDEKGKLEGEAYAYEAILNLPEIHAKINELHQDELNNGVANTIVAISKTVEEKMNAEKNESIVEKQKKQEEDLRREELLKKLKEQIARTIEEDRIARQAKLKKIKEMAGVYRGVIRDIKNKYNDKFLIQLKAEKKDIDGQRVSWDILIKDTQPIEDALKRDFLATLSTQMQEINSLRRNLFLFSGEYYVKYQEICDNITTAEDFYRELELSNEVDPGEDDENIKSIRKFRSDLDDSLKMILNKRKKISTYSLVIEWYKYLYLNKFTAISKMFSKKTISFWDNGEILYHVRNNELIFTSRIYDEDGNEIRVEESEPREDINKQDIYYFLVKNEDGEDKTLVFDVKTRKVGKNVDIHLQFITRYLNE